MNKTKIATLGILALFAVLTVSTVSAHVTQYFDPQDSSVPEGYCNTIEVKVMANITAPDTLKGGQFGIKYDQSCVNITNLVWGPKILPALSRWNAGTTCWGYGYDFVKYTFTSMSETGVVEICTLTLHCNSTEYCETGLNISCGKSCPECPIQVVDKNNNNLYPDNTTLVNGTFTCGTPPTFEKELVEGWNLISLPLANTTNMTVANIIDNSLGGKYDALYKYNASTHSFVPLSSTDEMENGVGYFIHMTAAGTWNYSGVPYESIDINLEKGLNCIGWVNETGSALPDALNSITGKYNYVARWNATSQSYEVYEQHAPDVFNDFWTMDRGEGYWIAAKEDCTLKYPYP